MSGIRDHHCPFCAPAAAEVLVETAGALVITDARPLCPGHVLVIPRAHIPAAVHAPREASVFQLAHVVAGALAEVMGQAGIYEHGGHPVCRQGTCRSGPVHAHLHVLPFREDLIDLWTDGVRRQGAAEASEGEHYLLQTSSTAQLERLPLPNAVPPHFIRTLLSRAMAERGVPWLPTGAPPSLHRRAILTTFQIFDRVGLSDRASTSIPIQQAA